MQQSLHSPVGSRDEAWDGDFCRLTISSAVKMSVQNKRAHILLVMQAVDHRLYR